MNPTVVAAAIGVGGTVIVGVAGFGASIWTTRRTIANDREKRVWDRRADVYLEMLAAVRARQIEKGTLQRSDEYTLLFEDVAGPGWVDPAIVDAYYSGGRAEAPDWFELESAMRAFASQTVLKAMVESSHANARIPPPSHAPGAAAVAAATAPAAAPATDPAESQWEWLHAAARNADDALVEAIRLELQGRRQTHPQRTGPVRRLLMRVGVRRKKSGSG